MLPGGGGSSSGLTMKLCRSRLDDGQDEGRRKPAGSGFVRPVPEVRSRRPKSPLPARREATRFPLIEGSESNHPLRLPARRFPSCSRGTLKKTTRARRGSIGACVVESGCLKIESGVVSPRPALAGRGRRRSAAKSPGEGLTRISKSPSPARHGALTRFWLRDLSPQERGEVKVLTFLCGILP